MKTTMDANGFEATATAEERALARALEACPMPPMPARMAQAGRTKNRNAIAATARNRLIFKYLISSIRASRKVPRKAPMVLQMK